MQVNKKELDILNPLVKDIIIKTKDEDVYTKEEVYWIIQQTINETRSDEALEVLFTLQSKFE